MSDDDGRPDEVGSEDAAAGASGSSADVGSVAEEAVKLFGALSGWAKTQGSDLGHGVTDAASGAAGGAADAMREVNEHIANGSAECQFCPICRTVHVIRELSPEVRNHLAAASANLMQAAASLMATAVPDQRSTSGAGGAREEGVEKIDVDDEWPEDP